jgi:hypothetical protein
MKKIYLLSFLLLICLYTNAQSVVINKYFNGATVAADAVELLVITDNLDMRGMIVKDFSSSMANDGGKAFTFTTDALWSSVRSGTLIVLRNDNSSADLTVGGSDFNLDLGLANTTYFTGATGTFDISTTEMIMIKGAATGTAGLTGSIHVLAGGTAGTQFNNTSDGVKLRSSSTVTSGNFGYATTPNSNISDYSGTNASSGTGPVLGSGNTTENTTYITNLRNAVLPVSLISFNAKKLSDKIQLNWSTASELNNSHFNIERSVDGKEFLSIGEVKGASTSHDVINYSFTDNQPSKGTNYYQLRQTDFDGASTVSKIVAVTMEGKKFEIVHVKPVDHTLVIEIYSPVNGSSEVMVMDLTGRIIAKETINLSEGINSASISTKNLSPGIHLVKVSGGQNSVSKKFIF